MSPVMLWIDPNFVHPSKSDNFNINFQFDEGFATDLGKLGFCPSLPCQLLAQAASHWCRLQNSLWYCCSPECRWEGKMHSKIYKLKEEQTSGLWMEYLATFASKAGSFLKKIWCKDSTEIYFSSVPKSSFSILYFPVGCI